MSQVSRVVAEAVVRAWLANEVYGSLSNLEGMPFFSYKKSVRIFLAQKNVLASNALWDGKPNIAYSLIKRHGFGDLTNASREDMNAIQLAKRLDKKTFQYQKGFEAMRDANNKGRTMLKGNARRRGHG